MQEIINKLVNKMIMNHFLGGNKNTKKSKSTKAGKINSKFKKNNMKTKKRSLKIVLILVAALAAFGYYYLKSHYPDAVSAPDIKIGITN